MAHHVEYWGDTLNMEHSVHWIDWQDADEVSMLELFVVAEHFCFVFVLVVESG